MTVNAIYNLACLKIEVNRFDEARRLLKQGFDINSKFFDKSHDFFGDYYSSEGDIAMKMGEKEKAKNLFKKAREIYIDKFGVDHFKVVILDGKI